MRLCLGKINFIVMGISALMILIGFIMMVAEPTTPEKFNPEVFSPWPSSATVVFLGYVLMIVGICIKGRKNVEENENSDK